MKSADIWLGTRLGEQA